MENRFRALPQAERKKILFLADDIRTHSGVGSVARELVVHSAHHFNFVNLGGAIQHKEEGQYIDLSEEVNKLTGLTDSYVRIIPTSGYGDPVKLRSVVAQEKPDAILIFTDPRYWIWLFDMEREIRTKIPIFYLSIWDSPPTPVYNQTYYRSVDLHMCISKQTKNLTEIILEHVDPKPLIKYLPHGINQEYFFPIEKSSEEYETFSKFRKDVFKRDDIEFVVFWNSRNIRRKSPADVIFSYRLFCDRIGKEKAKKCALIMHTEPVDNNGTDLPAVKEALCDPSYVNVFFSAEALTVSQMNLLYNLADVTMLISSNEGWGLSVTESMMAGKMVVVNVTGGMQDQLRFVDGDGKWIDFSKTFPSNHTGLFKECGEWAEPVFPAVRTIVGSPATPYIFDDICSSEDIAAALEKVYNLEPEERKRRGLAGRDWVLSEEAGMSSLNMSNRFIEHCDEGFEAFVPREAFEIIKIENSRRSGYIEHKLVDYSYE